MKKKPIGSTPVLYCICLFVISTMLPHWLQAKTETPSNAQICFIENKGQITDQYHKPRTDIDFKVSLPAMSIAIGDGQLHYQWFQAKPGKPGSGSPAIAKAGISTYRIDVALEGADVSAPVVAEDPVGYFETYYTGGLEGAIAHTYRKITYRNIYPDIDWVLYTGEQGLKYDFVVHPGGDPRRIRMRYSGHTSLSLTDGSLTAASPMGSITENKPYAYTAGSNEEVKSAFVLRGNTLSFDVAPPQSASLIIDPAISWSTYFGDFDADELYGVTANASGDVFAVGTVTYAGIANLVTTGAHQTTFMGTLADGILVKFNSSGVRQWATYYGGTDDENIWDVCLDNSGNIIITGTTSSLSGIATPGSHKSFCMTGGYEGFLVKFNSSGARQWGTYYNSFTAVAGYQQVTSAYSIACDPWDNIYLTGTTGSASDIATSGAHQATRPAASARNVYLAKFTPGGVRRWGTYFGASSATWIKPCDVAVSKQGYVYLAGTAATNYNMTTAGSYQPAIAGSDDLYLARFDTAGVLQWGSFYGGGSGELCGGVTCDTAGNVYLCGLTRSRTGLTTPGAYKPGNLAPSSDSDAVVVSFAPNGTRRWATFFGGTGGEFGMDISWGAPDAVYITGLTSSLVTTGPYAIGSGTPIPQNSNGGQKEGFVAKIADGGQQVVWGTYVGGFQDDVPRGIAYGGSGRVYIVGFTASPGMATTGAFQTARGYNYTAGDGLIRLYNDCIVQAIPNPITGADTVCEDLPYVFNTAAVPNATAYDWSYTGPISGMSTSGNTATFIFKKSGTPIQIAVLAKSNCGNTANNYKTIVVNKVAIDSFWLSPDSVICQNDSVRLTSYSGPYTFSWTRNDTLLATGPDSFYYASAAGNYKLILTDTKGCADTSLALGILVNPLPVPVVQLNNIIQLSTDSFATYQWYHNGTAITGATHRGLVATLNGSYAVMVTDSNGCSGLSAAIPVTQVGITGLPVRGHVTIYPNPATDLLHIAGISQGRYTVADVLGRKLLSGAISNKPIQLSALPAGSYVLLLTGTDGHTTSFRLSKN